MWVQDRQHSTLTVNRDGIQATKSYASFEGGYGSQGPGKEDYFDISKVYYPRYTRTVDRDGESK